MIRETDAAEMRLIRLRTAESRVFSEAYFVVRRRSRRLPIVDIVAEAERIVREFGDPDEVRLVPRVDPRFVSRRRTAAVFILGALSGIAATALACAVALLCLCR